MRAIALLLTLSFGIACYAADTTEAEKEEKQECIACHSLRIIHLQRLSRAAWERELDKMERWGATMKNRAALLDYLAAKFSADAPRAIPVMSQDGRKK
jgi:hypothetical protein